jgi:hypothetical protein
LARSDKSTVSQWKFAASNTHMQAEDVSIKTLALAFGIEGLLALACEQLSV